MRINTNVSALVSYHSLARSTGKLEKQIARLSTGLKISSAADDAAGLAISEKMRAQTKGLDRAYQNAQDGISLLQTAEGAVGDIHDALQRIRELSVHAANGAITDDDRVYIQQQVDQLISHINDIATQTQFNKKKLLNGDASVLWSSDSRDVGVIVTGKITSKDIFGNVESKAGNYKITFSESVTGTENVQKSNVLSLKHGTSASNVVLNTAESGLANLQALNLVEGSWRVETRETPFGGVSFYQNGQLTDKANIKIDSLQATGTPHTVAFGEYDIRVSNKVPMMATFDTNVVDGVNISSSNLARDLDVTMDTAVNQTGTGNTQMMYDDAAGGAGGPANVGINTNTSANIFTRYEIAETDRRDLLNNPIQVVESYITGDNAQVDMTLTYRSEAGDQTTATYTYMTSGAGTITHESTWKTAAAQTITYRVDMWDPTGGALGTGEWVTGADQTITITAGSDLEKIQEAMSGALAGRATVTHVDAAGESFISVENTNGMNTRLSFSGGFAGNLNLTGRYLTSRDGGRADFDFNTGKDYKTARQTADIAAGSSIAQVRSALNASLAASGGSVRVDTTDGVSKLVFTGETAGAYGANEIKITGATGTTTAWAELGGAVGTISVGATNVSGSDVYNGFTRTVTLGGQNIAGVAAALQTGVNDGSASNITATASTADISRISVSNNSMYRVQLSGGQTMTELNGGAFTINRGANNVNMNNTVYNGYTTTANVSNMRADTLTSTLNSTLNYALSHNQSLTNGRSNLITSNTGGQRTITVDNNYRTTTAGDPPVTTTTRVFYDIAFSNNGGSTSNVLNEIGLNVNLNRNGGTAASTALDFERMTGTIGTAGMTMEEVFDAINNNNGGRNLEATWVVDPNDDGNHWGQMHINNTSDNDSGAKRRSFMLRSSNGGQDTLNANRGIGNGDMDLTYKNGGKDSAIWQTRDAFKVNVIAQGNYNNGTAIDRSGTVGTGGAASYNSRNNANSDWLWEGAATEDARNTEKMNRQFGNLIENGLYTNFQVADGNNKGSNIDKNDKWILFTQAKTAPGATNVTVQVGDSRTGKQDAVTYSFNNGVVSGDHAATINQMLYNRTTKGVELLQHRIDFGANADTTGTHLQYGERAGAMDAGYTVEDWRMGQEVDAWYSHAYFGENTTYHFANGTVDSMIHDITVNRQNGINASIMFFKDNDGKFKYSMKGVDDDGIQIGSTTAPKTEEVVIEADGSATIEGVKFDKFDVNVAGMLTGDKFVVNVAAAAKLVTANTEATAGAYESYANIQVTGDPFLQGNENTGSTAQYRVKQNVEDGATFNLLGYYVNPANGASSALGVGYYDGDLVLKMNGGFNTDTTIGSTSPTTAAPGANIIHTEVNYQGKTQFSAGALVTSAYFQAMINQHDLVVADLVQGISYSDYKFGYVDGVFGELKQAGVEKYSDMNGSVVFDVVEATPDSIKFRVQGHFIDRDGNEYYEEDEEFFLYPGLNTDKDSSVQPVNDNPVMPVHLFKDSEFGGIFFDEFKLGKIDNWTAGDRFTIALTASGFVDNIDEASQLDPQNTNYSKVDEIGIFSDNRGTAMPMSYRFNDGVLDGNKVDLRIYQVAHNIVKEDSNNFYVDQVLDGTLTLSFADDYVVGKEIGKVDRAASFDVFYGQGDDYGVAHYYSNVKDIAQFYDKSGRFILDGNEETLTIRQGDREAKVAIGSAWEVGELASAVSDAIWDGILEQHDHMLRGEGDLLDQDKEKPYMVADKDRNRIFDFVNTVAHDNATESVVGTLIAHSVISGEGSALEFYGSEALQNAFGFNTIQQGSDTHFTANVVDAHSGSMVSSNVKVVAGTTSTDLLFEGVAVTIDNDLGIVYSTYDKTSGTFKLDVRDQINTVIHLADNTTTLQIGANEGEKMTLDLADMSAKALGIANISVRSRTSAARTITIIDNAINVVSQQRAVIGAQINRLEHTMSNLANTSTNLQDSRSRIVSADIAKEMMNKTRIDIVTQAGASMLVQANQMGSSVMSLLR